MPGFRDHTVLSFAFPEGAAAQLFSGETPFQEMRFPVTQLWAVRHEGWLLEARESTLYALEVGTDSSSDLQIRPTEPVCVTISLHDRKNGKKRTFCRPNPISLLQVTPGKNGQLTCQDAEKPETSPAPEEAPARTDEQDEPGNPNPDSGVTPPQAPESDSAQEPSPATTQQPDPLRAELEESRRACAQLQQLLEARVEDLLASLDQSQELVTEGIRQKTAQTLEAQAQLEALQTQEKEKAEELSLLETRTREAQERLDREEERRSAIQGKLKEMKLLAESASLDTVDAEIRIRELRERLMLDEETVQLLESGDMMRPGSVLEYLQEGESCAEKAEQSLKRVIRFQEFFQKNLARSILIQDGSILETEKPEPAGTPGR